MEKIVVYTAIFGGYDTLLEQKKFKNVDFICFSDTHFNSASWEVRVVGNLPFGEDHTRNNRFYKILPHLHFPEYKYSVYIDGNVLLKRDPHELVKNYLSAEAMAAFDHFKTVLDPRNCIYEEHKAILALAEKIGNFKDSKEVMQQQINLLKAEKYPERNGLISGGVLVRSHHHFEVVKVMEEWWELVKNYSKRDQLSFNFVAWKHRFSYGTIPGDIRRRNRYVYVLGKHRKNLKFQLLKFRLRQYLNFGF